jgi:hypothetical protein
VTFLDNIGRLLDFFRRTKRSYQLCFGSPAGNDVLKDLAGFCGAAEAGLVVKSGDGSARGRPVDKARTFMMLGRREVWLHIQNNLHLSSEEIYRLATGRNILRDQTEDEDNV